MKRTLLICAVWVGGITHAATNDLLSWEQCLETTRAQSPELASARAAVRELEFGVASASAGFLPDISASASASYGETERDDDWTVGKSSSATLSLSQDLFTAGANVAKRNRALAQYKVGEEQYRKTLADVELSVRLAYIDVLYAQDLIDLTRRIAERRANNVRLIQLRFDGGRENAGSLARSKAQLAQAEYEVREARRALDYALRNLAAAMGQLDPVAGAQGDLRAAPPEELSELQNLMEQTPSYHIAVTQIESSKLGMQITRSGRFPTLRFSASTGLSDGSGYDTYNGRWSMGLSASMPIYTGNQLKSDVAAAHEKVIQSEMDMLDTANTLMATLQLRWNAYKDAVENETVQVQLLEAEKLRAEISTAKYKQGLLSYEDWDTIESNLITQDKTHLQRRRTSEVEQARWKNGLGWSEWYTTEKGE